LLAHSAALVVFVACGPARAPAPAPGNWEAVTHLLDSVTAAGAAPGAVLGVSLNGRHYFYGAGRLGTDDPARPDSSTIYDLASVSKVVALTTLAMQAVESGLLDLDAPVSHYLPEFVGWDSAGTVQPVTIRHLLTHSSGLPAWRPLYQETATRREALALADTTRLLTPPGAAFVYSDLGAIVLTQVIERLLGARIDTLFARRVAEPLGLTDTRYLPPPAWLARIPPTENDPWRGRTLRGEVHDENAVRLDGVSGHAGLFGSARDLVKFADWLIAEVNADGPPSPFAIHLREARAFTTVQDLPPGSSRALGWDTPSGESSGGRYLRPGSFGHTGFTGTSIWIDPSRRLAIVLLSNRVNPTRQNSRWGPVRALVANRVVEALAPESLTR